MHELALALFFTLPWVGFWWCCCGSCANCAGTEPGNVRVVISGMANNDCANCTAWNGSFVAPPVSAYYCLAAAPCNYQYTGIAVNGSGSCVGGSIADFSTIEVSYQLRAGRYYLVVRLERIIVVFSNTCVEVTVFEKDYGATKPNCYPAAAETVPWKSDAGAYCDGSLATCTVNRI